MTEPLRRLAELVIGLGIGLLVTWVALDAGYQQTEDDAAVARACEAAWAKTRPRPHPHPEAAEAELRKAIRANGAIRPLVIDCAEAPCVALVRATPEVLQRLLATTPGVAVIYSDPSHARFAFAQQDPSQQLLRTRSRVNKLFLDNPR